jgi:hypothetical protein
LLRIEITAEVDGDTITYGRYGEINAAKGFAYASADDAERLAAVVKAITGKEPKVYQRSDGTIMIECYGGHLEGLMCFAELASVIARWLEETSR